MHTGTWDRVRLSKVTARVTLSPRIRSRREREHVHHRPRREREIPLHDGAEAARSLGVSLVAARAALRRLARKAAIAPPARGFHVIIPPEYRRLGCLPPEQFIPQLMAARGLVYYVSLLSAAKLHGAAHHRPQQFQVMVERPRPPIICGQVRGMTEELLQAWHPRQTPTSRLETGDTHNSYSTPEGLPSSTDRARVARACGHMQQASGGQRAE